MGHDNACGPLLDAVIRCGLLVRDWRDRLDPSEVPAFLGACLFAADLVTGAEDDDHDDDDSDDGDDDGDDDEEAVLLAACDAFLNARLAALLPEAEAVAAAASAANGDESEVCADVMAFLEWQFLAEADAAGLAAVVQRLRAMIEQAEAMA